MSAHVLVAAGGDCHHVADLARRLLRDEHQLEHTTLQVDHTPITSTGHPDLADEHCHEPHGLIHRAP